MEKKAKDKNNFGGYFISYYSYTMKGDTIKYKLVRHNKALVLGETYTTKNAKVKG